MTYLSLFRVYFVEQLVCLLHSRLTQLTNTLPMSKDEGGGERNNEISNYV
jgi:hypothetical protein